jgi:hypothetical protein
VLVSCRKADTAQLNRRPRFTNTTRKGSGELNMERSVLIEVAEEVLQRPLITLGYLLEMKPPGVQLEFWFEKKPIAPDEMYRIIECQPSGFDKEHLFSIAINLIRCPARNPQDFTKRRTKLAKYNVRLAPCLWEVQGNKGAMDQWWEFGDSLTELKDSYKDILDKLMNYGIPFLENPSSSWWKWAGQEPPQ